MRHLLSLLLALALALPVFGEATQVKQTGAGYAIGTTPTQPVGFNGATPTVQRSGVNQDIAGAAQGTLTFSGQPGQSDTVVIDGVTYTYRSALTSGGTANQVLRSADQAASQTNLVAAINGTAGLGITYGLGTVVHPSVSAVVASATVVVTARVAGTAGNALATTESSSVLAWGASTLAGGTAAPTTTQLAVLVNELRAALAEKGLIKGSP